MKKITNGHGTLRRRGDISRLSLRGTVAYAVPESGTGIVRIVMRERVPGGAELEVKLSAEDAAQLASRIYALARTAIIQNERAAAVESRIPALQVAAA